MPDGIIGIQNVDSDVLKLIDRMNASGRFYVNLILTPASKASHRTYRGIRVEVQILAEPRQGGMSVLNWFHTIPTEDTWLVSDSWRPNGPAGWVRGSQGTLNNLLMYIAAC